MSDTTREKMKAAIQEHIADEFETTDIMLTDFVLAVAAVRMDASAIQGATSYSWWCDGSYHSVRGLVDLLDEWSKAS